MAQTKDEAKRIAIRDAVIADVVEHGLGNSPVSGIAKRAKLSAGTIYTYYPNKDEMLSAIFLEIKTDLHRVMMSAHGNGSDPEDALRRMWMAMFDFILERPTMFAFYEILSADNVLTNEHRDKIAGIAQDIHRVLDDAVENKLIEDMPMDCLVSAFLSPAPALAKRMLAKGDTDTTKAELLYRSIRRGLQASAVAR